MREHGGWVGVVEKTICRGGKGTGYQRLQSGGLERGNLRECDHCFRPGPKKLPPVAREFLAKRGASAIVSRGRALKHSQGALFASIQQRYGVPPGPLLAIWGMETAFGSQHGNQNTLSAVATLAYDCRRAEYFTEQLYATLKLIDRGVLSPSTRGSMHGEIGQTQFLPKNILAYGTGNLDVAANALTSTANFLKAHGWRAARDINPAKPILPPFRRGTPPVYQRAIALMGRQIDGGDGIRRRVDAGFSCRFERTGDEISSLYLRTLCFRTIVSNAHSSVKWQQSSQWRFCGHTISMLSLARRESGQA